MKPGDFLVPRIKGAMWDEKYAGVIVSVCHDRYAWIDEVGYNVLWPNGKVTWEIAEDVERNYAILAVGD